MAAGARLIMHGSPAERGRKGSTLAMRIRLFGLDQDMIRQSRENVDAALKAIGVRAEIEHVDKIDEITMSGVLETPAVMVGGHIVCEGKIPSAQELITWIEGALATEAAVAVH